MANQQRFTYQEAADRTGLSHSTVRYYHRAGLLPPVLPGPRSAGKFGNEHIAALRKIAKIRRERPSLADIYNVLYPEDDPDDDSGY